MVKVGGVHVKTHWLIVGCGVVCHLHTHTTLNDSCGPPNSVHLPDLSCSA